jgi:adenylate cyclase class 2
MVEVEIKLRGDLQEVERRLFKFGAFFEGEFYEEDLYFNSPLRDFSLTDEALRIRFQEEGGLFTYKGPKLDPISKSREEIEIKICEPLKLREILLRLGFQEVGWVRKRRKKFKLDPFWVFLDEVEGLGGFVEIEGKAEGSYEGLLQKALELLRKLGLKGELIRESYLELILKEGRP